MLESEAFLDIVHTVHRVEIFHLASLLRSGPTPMWGIGNGAATVKAQSPGQTLGISASRIYTALHRNMGAWPNGRCKAGHPCPDRTQSELAEIGRTSCRERVCQYV